MRKILSAILAALMIVSVFAFTASNAAEDANVVFKFNYSDKNNGIVDHKDDLATIIKDDQTQGEKALKVIPNPLATDSSKLTLECYTLTVTPEELEKANYVTIKYKYVTPQGIKHAQRMEFNITASGGAVSKYSNFTSTTDVVANNWAYALFDISSIKEKIVKEEGKIFKQFHLAPFGGATLQDLSVEEIFYISEIAFYSAKPDIKNPADGVGAAPSATPTTPATPATPAKTETPAAPVEEVLFTFNYNDVNNGLVDKKLSATLTKDDESQGEKALKIVPMPEGYETPTISLDCWSLKYDASQLKNVKFVSIRYKYVAPEGVQNATQMTLKLLPLGGALRGTVEAKSISPLVTNQWAEAIFDFNALSSVLNSEGQFRQMHFLPYGGTSVASLKADEVMYISEFKFLSKNPDKNATYEVSFARGNPDADGTLPDSFKVKDGEEYTLPQPGITLKGGEFQGWHSSDDGKIYAPGTKIVSGDSPVKYTARFKITADFSDDSKSLVFPNFCNGIVNHVESAYTENVTFDGKEAVKITINKNYEKQDSAILLDGWSYTSAGIDLSKYKYLVVSYYLEGTLPKPAYIKANYMHSNVLTKTFGNTSTEALVSGKWAYVTIDLSGVTEVLKEGLDTYNLRQMHIYPFQGLTVGDFNGNEALYISQLTFFKEKPQINVHEAYMKGYEGGLFKPQGNMTRAEACTIVARLAAGSDDLVPTDKTTAFTDVPAEQWYKKYISYVESLGYLKSYSGAFLPDQQITRAEFVELIYNMGLLKDAGKNGTFTDVPADHARAAVIAASGKAGLVNGYDNGDGTFSFKPDATITRAEVVTIINRAYGRTMKAEGLSADVRYSFFDVPNDFWAYADICEATLAHVQDGDVWAYAVVSPASLLGGGNRKIDFAAGEAYLAELDKIAEAKKQEILATKSNVTIKGTSYYVDAANGNDANDGKSPEKAWKTVDKVNAAPLKAGDGVFFKRGDIYRTRMTAKPGVTYSAYGEGEKPRFYGSPENGADPSKWTLMEGTNNIWIYATEMVDVGAIVLDEKEAALKEIPDLKNGEHYVRKTDKVFDIITELNENHEFYCEIKNKNAGGVKGKIYFKCDEGNPGEVFKNIEFNTKNNVIAVGGEDVTFDNICVMFGGSHGIGTGTRKNLTVQNCVFGWIGGAIQNYNDNGTVTRFGNGVEIYGGCDGYTIDNCYVYQCYDAGLTHQYGNGTNNNSMYNVTYSNNLIEDCIYSIEYFNGDSVDGKAVRDGKNFKIIGNIMRRAGYGFGNQRPDGNVSSHIKGWTSRNEYEKGTYIIENNIFDRGMWSLVQSQASHDAWCPIYRNNTYIQWIGGPIGYHKGGVQLMFDSLADIAIRLDLEDNGATVYWLPESYKHHGFLTR